MTVTLIVLLSVVTLITLVNIQPLPRLTRIEAITATYGAGALMSLGMVCLWVIAGATNGQRPIDFDLTPLTVAGVALTIMAMRAYSVRNKMERRSLK